jgi:hypothetical protein
MVDDLEIEYTLEGYSNIYLELAVNQMLRKVLIIANIYSKDNTKTFCFYSRIKIAFKTCKTLLL